jgi:hypothetical protein
LNYKLDRATGQRVFDKMNYLVVYIILYIIVSRTETIRDAWFALGSFEVNHHRTWMEFVADDARARRANEREGRFFILPPPITAARTRHV